MRWERLFADLEAQLDAAERQELDAEVAERVRIEVGAVTLLDRVRAHAGHQLVVHVAGAAVPGAVVDVGADYALLEVDAAGRALVPAAAIEAVAGLGRASLAEPSPVRRRLGVRGALRALVRDRAPVQILTRSGRHAGLLSRVGSDHVDVVPDRCGERGDPAAGRATPVVVSLAAVTVVRSSR